MSLIRDAYFKKQVVGHTPIEKPPFIYEENGLSIYVVDGEEHKAQCELICKKRLIYIIRGANINRKMKVEFKLPTKSNLKSRISTINNAFVISITPWIKPSEIEIEKYYKKLDFPKGECCYCGEKATSMDHIHPLVKDGKPTGYITEINNLIPCCASCNSSKGNKEFEIWYKSHKNVQRLNNKGVSTKEIEKRYIKIKKFIKALKPFLYDMKIINNKGYKYNDNLKYINGKLKEFDEQNGRLRMKILDQYNKMVQNSGKNIKG